MSNVRRQSQLSSEAKALRLDSRSEVRRSQLQNALYWRNSNDAPKAASSALISIVTNSDYLSRLNIRIRQGEIANQDVRKGESTGDTGTADDEIVP